MSLRAAAIRGLCAIAARPSLSGVWSTVSVAARYFDGIGSGSSLERSGEMGVVEMFARSDLPKIFVDVGANVGDYTAAVATAVPSVAIHCFEAAPDTAADLVERFAGDGRVVVNALGLSDREETHIINVPAHSSGIASFYDHIGDDIARTETIQCTTLDVYCEGRGIREIGLLKVDVEGHELAVLRGANRLLSSRAIKAIQFDGGASYNSRIFFRDFWHLFTHHGYRIHRVLPFGLAPVTSYRDRDEACLPTIYLATV